MKIPTENKHIYFVFYFAAAFALIYGCKYVIDALAWSVANWDDTMKNLAGAAGRIIDIFSIVLIGFVIAYILDPFVTAIQKKLNITRRFSVSLLYIIILFIFIFVIFTFINKISVYDKNDLTNALYLAFLDNKAQFSNMYRKLFDIAGRYDYFNFIPSLTAYFENIEIDFLKTVRSVGKWTVNILLSLVIAFYYLKDKKYLIAKTKRITKIMLPQKVYNTVLPVFHDINTVFSGYIRGQLTDALIMAVLISAALGMIKVPFAVFIGILSGFANIIPYFGAVSGLVLAAVTALIASGPAKAALAAVVILILQQIDGLVIVPRVVGDKVSLSPVMVIIVLGIAGNLFGITGMIFAVPAAALIKMFLSRYLERKAEKKTLAKPI